MQINVKRSLFVTLGTLFLVVGVIGIVVPILPTTPFLLLAAFFYERGSEKFHNWLLTNKILGAYIGSYSDDKGIPLKVKLFTIVLLWTVIASTVIFVVDELVFNIILVSVAIGISIHVAFIKGHKKNKDKHK